jgi:hypothetical protein
MSVPGAPGAVLLRECGEVFHHTVVEMNKQFRLELVPRLAISRSRDLEFGQAEFAE